MGRLGVPKGRAQDPNARPVFPSGLYSVVIDQVLETDIYDWMTTIRHDDQGKAKVPFLRNADAELVSVQFGEGEPVEDGQEDPGNLKLFLKLTAREGDVDLDEFDWDDHKDEVGYNMLRNVNLFVNFAHALGCSYEEDYLVYVEDDFLQRLRNGDFNGERVLVEVSHTQGKDGKTYENINAFSPAA